LNIVSSGEPDESNEGDSGAEPILGVDSAGPPSRRTEGPKTQNPCCKLVTRILSGQARSQRGPSLSFLDPRTPVRDSLRLAGSHPRDGSTVHLSICRPARSITVAPGAVSPRGASRRSYNPRR
jgi:hypothetical protein